MDEKINSRLVQEYGEAYATSVVDKFFAVKEKISGNEITTLCDTHQVNLFVIRELLQAWQQEVQKYKSPYFDYEAKEVKESLILFRNTLSNHISIAKDHFAPLLKKAVGLTIYLILSPYDFYSYTLGRHRKGKIEVKKLRNEVKYIKINRAPLEVLVNRLERRGMDYIAGDEAFLLFEQILEEVNFTPEDVGPHIARFNMVLPLEVSALYESEGGMPTAVSFRDSAIGAMLSNQPIYKKPVVTVAEDYQRIPHLKEWLTINQKFMFTKMLFNGNFDSFNRAITQIDKLSSLDEAIHYLDSHYPNWNRKSEEYEEFVTLLEQRFR